MLGMILLAVVAVGGILLYQKYTGTMKKINEGLGPAINKFNTDPVAKSQLQAMFKPKANYSSMYGTSRINYF